jgi:DNA-binding transcriptional LysR family regulator
MELRHLRTIEAVARHGSLTRAGEELYLSQSAISQQIRRLELELGFDVFRRTSRRVELTAEGRVILGCAHRVLAEVDGLHIELEEMTGLLRGQLRIGGVYPTGPYDVFGMLADFRAAHPEVAVHMIEDTQDGVLEALRTDELDCAFTALNPDTLGDEFAATLLWEEEFVVALPLGHPLCARPRITFQELAEEDRPHRLPRQLGAAPAPGAHDGRPGTRAAQRVRVHGDGRRARADEQGPGRGRHPALGRRAARPADRAAPHRSRAAHLASRASLARGAPPDGGRQGLPTGRARPRRAHRAARPARRVSKVGP